MKYSYVAKCGYPGKESFYFFTDEMHVDSLEELEKITPREIAKQWARISPHPPPVFIEWHAGLIQLVTYKDE